MSTPAHRPGPGPRFRGHRPDTVGAPGVWVSDEIASTITEFSPSDGAKTGSVEVPSIYRPANVQGDFGSGITRLRRGCPVDSQRRFHVRPTFFEPAAIDATTIVDSWSSANRLADLQASIVNILRDQDGLCMHVESEYPVQLPGTGSG